MKKIYYTNEHIAGYVNDIIRQLIIDDFKPDYIVGLTRGGLVPALMLSHYLKVPMHTLKVSMRDDDHCESNLWMAEDAFGHEQEKKNNGEPIYVIRTIARSKNTNPNSPPVKPCTLPPSLTI